MRRGRRGLPLGRWCDFDELQSQHMTKTLVAGVLRAQGVLGGVVRERPAKLPTSTPITVTR
jgi:hypothetical protein